MDIAKRAKEIYEAEFVPGTNTPVEARQAHALEYIAYNLGQINRKMDKLTDTIFGINR